MIAKLWTMGINRKEKEMSEVVGTIGDRILHLLRTGGRADRGTPYEQKDLVAWLNGEEKAPDGKLYHVGTSTSTMSRIVSGNAEPSLKMAEAICDIFHADLKWLISGVEKIDQEKVERFVSDEANTIGQIVDAVDQDVRNLILYVAQALQDINHERKMLRTDRKDLRAEVYSLLTDTVSAMSGDNKARANSVIRKIHSREALDIDFLSSK